MLTDDLIIEMTKFNEGDPKQVQHLIKVYQFAHVIGVQEGLDAHTQKVLDVTAILHDIGIKPARAKYGSSDGKLQEKEGPFYARQMLGAYADIPQTDVERICYLIAHHHTYQNVVGLDYQILLEADFLVNAFEDNLPAEGIIHIRNNVFKTKTGLELINTMFGLHERI